MKNTTVERLKNARLLRKAQMDSHVLIEIRQLQNEIVEHSFAKGFDNNKHREMMAKLKQLKSDYSQIKLT